MGQINIYRIDPKKREDFLIRLENDFKDPHTQSINKNSVTYNFAFYHQTSALSKEISWAWIFNTFGLPVPTSAGAPKGVLTITVKTEKDQTVYAVTFGTAFFCVDKFCDRDFGFEYACRVPYYNIRLTALTNPGSVRNKTINSYQNYDKLEFDSGESFAKIKGKIGSLSKDDFLKDTIEVGTALKFQLKKDSLDNIVELILYIEDILKKAKITSIPRFSLVKDQERISGLQDNLISAIKEQLPQVIVSEFGIVGSLEIFNRYDSYQLSYKRNKEEFSELNLKNILFFCKKYNIQDTTDYLNIKIACFEDGRQQNCVNLLSVLDFMDEEEHCLLDQGEWYEFNDDYLKYLKESLSEIPVFSDSKYDLTQAQLDEFQRQKAIEAKGSPEYQGKDFDIIEKEMKKKYYAELAFNMMREKEGFLLGDRKTIPLGDANIEVADLYSDNAIISVKRGNSSADFSYVADQSSMAISAYKHREIPNLTGIKKIIIWLILMRKEHLKIYGTCLDWDALNMLVLKNRLDQWKKDVRLAGLEPEIWINYQTKD